MLKNIPAFWRKPDLDSEPDAVCVFVQVQSIEDKLDLLLNLYSHCLKKGSSNFTLSTLLDPDLTSDYHSPTDQRDLFPSANTLNISTSESGNLEWRGAEQNWDFFFFFFSPSANPLQYFVTWAAWPKCFLQTPFHMSLRSFSHSSSRQRPLIPDMAVFSDSATRGHYSIKKPRQSCSNLRDSNSDYWNILTPPTPAVFELIPFLIVAFLAFSFVGCLKKQT